MVAKLLKKKSDHQPLGNPSGFVHACVKNARSPTDEQSNSHSTTIMRGWRLPLGGPYPIHNGTRSPKSWVLKKRKKTKQKKRGLRCLRVAVPSGGAPPRRPPIGKAAAASERPPTPRGTREQRLRLSAIAYRLSLMTFSR